MFYDGNKAYSPLVCIGRNIPIAGGGHIGCLCVSSSGRFAIVESDPFHRGESAREFISRVNSYISEIRTWSPEKVDAIAADHTFKSSGQAARVCDIMARNGYLTYSDTKALTAGMADGLSSQPVLIVVGADPDELPMRRIEYSQGALSKSGLLFSLVEDIVAKTISAQ